MLSSFSFVGAFSCSSLLVPLLLVSTSGLRKKLGSQQFCEPYNPFTYSVPGAVFKFDFSDGAGHAAYKQNDKVVLQCPQHLKGSCTAQCSNPGGNLGGWRFSNCSCKEEGVCVGKKIRIAVGGNEVIEFDLHSKRYEQGDQVQQTCPNGMTGTCVAECSDPANATLGGWTFQNCNCASTTECKRYNSFRLTLSAGTVSFDFSKGYTLGQQVTGHCPSGTTGSCVAHCSDPARSTNGGWTFQNCNCERTTECKRYKRFKYRRWGDTFVFDFSKGYARGELVNHVCPSGATGTCVAECSDPTSFMNGGWTFRNCNCVSTTKCKPYKRFSLFGGGVIFDFSKGYLKGEQVAARCPAGMVGSCVADCSDPTSNSFGGWTFQNCNCTSTTECKRYKPFRVSLPSGTVAFDLSQNYKQGARVTGQCPSGTSGTCAAECSDPLNEIHGGWTFKDCNCVSTTTECKRYNSFKLALSAGTVSFDFSKGYTPGEQVTGQCPFGTTGRCVAECSDPRAGHGGWTFKNCNCVSTTECARYKPFKLNFAKGTIVFDFSKGYGKGERLRANCPPGMAGTCFAECSEPGGGDGGWTFKDCLCRG
eukprot:TRINITY_DN7073_c0_g2_i1.p1 TRINITY_DN7073_c0_g2~~TRINITY_DN7073_c0_g2_i1.p1  ORF type:complete len:589 (-),score=41.70 TRINITY_DN7073_c0_g2_i1:360-2126(-)